MTGGLRDRPRAWVAAGAALLALVALALLAPAVGAEPAPWRTAEAVRAGLFDAQAALLLGDRPADPLAAARRGLRGPLARAFRRDAPGALGDLRGALAAAEAAYRAEDPVALAAARGRAVGALRAGAYSVTLSAVARGEVATARGFLLVRDFRRATRFTRPGVDAVRALDALAAGEVDAPAAATQVRKDLLDAYQARMRSYLDEAVQADERGFGPAAAEAAALAAGYWRILAPGYTQQRGGPARAAAGRHVAAFARAAAAGGDVARARAVVVADLDGFTAAPFTAEEQARRGGQLTRFLDLVPIEYDDGTADGRVTIPFELQEAVAFRAAASEALDDLEPVLRARDPAQVDAAEQALAELARYVADAAEGRAVVETDRVDAAHARAADALEAVFPQEWEELDAEADFDLIEISLDQMQAAVGASQLREAEQARLSAYAFFEFGPEITLRAFDPALVADVEGLFWYGARDADGLAELIADGAGTRQLRETRLVIDEALDEARAQTGEATSGATVITNAALIVFREGLEAVLIIAAITAGMVGTNRALRRPVLVGALLGLPASVALFFVAQAVIGSLARYGEKLEAVVGIVAIAVLLVVMNWFFHRIYWTEWIAGHRRRGKELVAGAAGAAGAASATIAGLYLLGFSSVFREGFETVLFLQALQLSSGGGVVAAGVALGLVGTAVVGAATFALERKLPYKRMLIVTGGLLGFVLMVLTGTTARTLQGVGWMPITPVGLEPPLWAGTWLGVFPTVETLGAQAGALAFVVGSYHAAGWWRKRRARTRRGRLAASTPERAA